MKTLPTVFVALATMMLAGCSSPSGSTGVHGASSNPAMPTSTAVGQPLAAAHGVEAAIGAVPWPQVGPGWMLATWSPISSQRPGVEPPPGEPSRDTAITTLYLVDPAAGRYAITTFPPTGNKAGPELVDWSGDGSHALFYAEYAQPSTAILVDLHTGVQTRLPVQGLPRFTRPDGKALLVEEWHAHSSPVSLVRVDLGGNQQLTYPVPPDFRGYLSTPDGTTLVLGTNSGLALMGNDGKAGKAIPVAGQTGCVPMRWWDANPGRTVLAGCDGTDGKGRRLWLVPINGDTPTALTAPNDGQKGPDYGDVGAWRLPAGTFVQSLGACGVLYLAKLNADGTTSEVTVPDVDSGSVEVIGVDGADLRVRARAACGGGQAILNYDPAANTSTVLLGGPVNGGGVVDVVPYPDQR